MRDEPDGRDLLETAREALVAEILPLLSGDARYTAAMIANAMRMAMHPEADEGAERAALKRLRRGRGAAGQKNPHPSPLPRAGEGVVGTVTLNTALAEAIRSGQFDPGTERHYEMRDALMSMTVERLALANPDALKAERASGAIPDGFEPWAELP